MNDLSFPPGNLEAMPTKPANLGEWRMWVQMNSEQTNKNLQKMVKEFESYQVSIETSLAEIKKLLDEKLNGDQGIFLRLQALELWKSSTTKFNWLVITAIVGLTITIVQKMLFG